MKRASWITAGLIVGLIGLGLARLPGCGQERGHGYASIPAAARAAMRYKCAKCGMLFSEEEARKSGYRCTMAGGGCTMECGELMPVKSG
jgi:hypothetical protein